MVPEGIVDSLVAWLAVAGFACASRLLWAGGLEERLAERITSGGHPLLSTLLLVYTLSALLTNDGGLFLAVPLVSSVAARCGLSVETVAVAVSIAANAGSTLTPFGNPQNMVIYLAYKPNIASWLLYSITASLAQLASLALLAPRLAASSVKPVKAKVVEIRVANMIGAIVAALSAASSILDSLPLAFVAAAGGAAVCVVLDAGYPDFRLLALLAVFLTAPRLVASHAPIPGTGVEAYLAILGLSQVTSNVPAAVVAVERHIDWRVVLLASNIGGLGTVIASLANLIAVRLMGCSLRGYHRVALPAATIAWLLGLAAIIAPAPHA